MMVRPAAFGYNPETAASNAFQRAPAGNADAAAAALREFDALADQLRGAGVEVIVVADTPEPPKPDAIFPNNWVSFHADGTIVLYPMLAPNRRAERREELLAAVVRQGAFRGVRCIDLSGHEAQGHYLEGTGSLVLDRAAHIAYACLSPRTTLDALGDFAQQLDYELIAFEAADAHGRAVYHTNVLMSVGAGFAVVCGAAIGAPGHRDAVFARLASTGHEIIDLTMLQMQHFAGNLLQLAGGAGTVVALSVTAWDSLDAAQRAALARHGTVVRADIPTIERLGGGSVRCMLAEIHLPKRG